MINKKRPRSASKGKDEENFKKPKLEEVSEITEDYLIHKVFTADNLAKTNCSICQKDISKNIKILCSVCKEFIFCLDCLINEKPHGPNNGYKHDYHVIDKLNFQVFTSDWTASEELLLLTAIEKYGLDNWTDISEFMGTKSKLQCEAHYYNFYYKSETDRLPDAKDFIIKRDCSNIRNSTEISIIDSIRKENEDKEMKKIEEISKNQGKIPELIPNKDNKNNRSRVVAKIRNKKDQTTVTSASEILGYWPKREEFDIEFLNDAELEIAELEFLDDDTESERNLKLNVLKIYNAQLEEREKRKKFVIKRGLLDLKKQMNIERRLSKEDRELYSCLKPFARFMEESEFNDLFEGFVLEKNLRQRLNQLKYYRNLGHKSYEDIEKYLEIESRNKKEDKKNNIGLDYDGIGFKLSKFFSKNANVQALENDLEKNLSKEYGISKAESIELKKAVIKELITEATIAEKRDKIEKIIKDSNIPKEKYDHAIDYIITLK